MTDVLARLDDALSPDEITTIVRERLGEVVVDSGVEFRTFTLTVSPDAWFDVARVCRDEPSLAFDMFDCLFGVDAREEGFDVVAILYSTSTGNRVALRTRCPGGREAPRCPSITELYRGADWMERETWDMFGIEFDGHPGLAPRLLTVENFEGWPLRKDFHLTARVAKPWPGVKEPVELDEDGNVIERVTGIGDAPGPYDLDKAIAEQARAANPRPEDAEAEAEIEDAADGDAADGDTDAAEDADTETATSQDATSDDEDVDAPAAAQQKADDRRREQAEARRRKAEERAAADDPGDGDAAEGSDREDDA